MTSNLGEVKIPVQEAVQGAVLHVRLTGMKRFRFRLWLAHGLVRLAARIAPIRADVEVVEDGD